IAIEREGSLDVGDGQIKMVYSSPGHRLVAADSHDFRFARRELFEEVRGCLDQPYGHPSLHGHVHMKIDLGPDHVAVEPVSACLSGLSILLEGLDADEAATTGPACIDGHASGVRTLHVLESLH